METQNQDSIIEITIRKAMNFMKRYFLTGMVIVAPITATYIILKFLFLFIYNNLPKNILYYVVPEYFHDSILIKYSDVLVSFVVTFISIILIGYFFSNYFGRKMIELGEYILDRLPLVNKIYSILKQIVEQIVNNMRTTSSAGHKVALVEFPRKGVKAIGFVTSKASWLKSSTTEEDEYYNVFIPTTPNPTSGFLVIAHKSEIEFVDMTMEEAMRYIISAGMAYGEKK